MTIFINGKQKRVRRPPTIDGIPVDELIRQNADPIWLLQNEMYELLEETLNESQQISSLRSSDHAANYGQRHSLLTGITGDSVAIRVAALLSRMATLENYGLAGGSMRS